MILSYNFWLSCFGLVFCEVEFGHVFLDCIDFYWAIPCFILHGCCSLVEVVIGGSYDVHHV